MHGEDARFTRAHTKRKLKFTLPGPMTICDTIADAHYGTRADMAMAFAALLNEEAREIDALGVDVIQFDEPAFNVFMDEVKEWGIAALEAAIEGFKCKTAVHICYGYGIEANIKWKETLGSEWRQYEEIFPAHQCQPHRAGVARMSGFEGTVSLIPLLTTRPSWSGHRCRNAEVETPEAVAAILGGAEICRRRSASRLAPIAAWRPCRAALRWASFRRWAWVRH